MSRFIRVLYGSIVRNLTRLRRNSGRDEITGFRGNLSNFPEKQRILGDEDNARFAFS